MESYIKMNSAINNLVIAFIVILSGMEARASMEVTGNAKLYGIRKDLPQLPTARNSLQASTKIQSLYTFNDSTKLESAYEFFINIEKPVTHTNKIADYRVIDFKPYLHDEQATSETKILLMHNLNRLNFNLNTTVGDFAIGRQPIAFGSSKSINPTDTLTPFAINTIDKEERNGVDAFVHKLALNELSVLETGVVIGEDAKKEKSAIYLRPRFNIEKLEVVFSAMYFKEKKLIGLDLQHPIEDAGFWFETAFVDQKKVARTNVADFWRTTTGVDYKFASSLYLAFEYHHNGASGKTNVRDPLSFIYLRDKHYFILTSSYEFTPLITGSIQNYYNTHDQSNLSALKIDYNYSDNVYFNLGSFYSIGHKNNTEMGRLGKTFYTSVRYYY